MPDEQDQNYSVGYAKPPLHTRFQKGQSGNRKGRPVGSRNTATLFDKTFNERVLIKKNGRQKKITKAELIVELVFNKAASGDWRPLKLLFELLLSSREGGAEPFRAQTPLEALNELIEKADEADRLKAVASASDGHSSVLR
jgi:Family of unknown function (DUF5681)